MERKVHIIFRSVLLIFIGAFVLFSIGRIIFSKVNAPSAQKSIANNFVQPQNDAGDFREEATTIEVKTPQSGEVVKSPLTVTGEAKGWYFEGVFPVKVLDDTGKEIGHGQMQAQGNWTADVFVPFEGKIEFSQPATKTGTIVFQKDNPSGLPENDEKVELFISFEK
jgi:hypothetical protein